MLAKFDLHLIKPNPWNPNDVDPINQEKLEKSLSQYGQNMPIIVREVEGGNGGTELQIVDGEHRYHAANSLGWDDILAINLGEVSDEEAKRKTIIANSRYGQDDNQRLFDLLSTEGVFETADDIISTLPIDETELHGLFSSDEIDFSDLDDDLDTGGDSEIDLGIEPTTPTQTHRILRFKVAIEDADKIEDMIDTIKSEQGYSSSDALTNAGDSLVYLLNSKESQ